MQDHETTGRLIGKRLWVLFLVITGVVLGWQVFQLVPAWIEGQVRDTLLEQDAVLTAFPVEDIGWQRTRIGPGAVIKDANYLQWESIWIDYRIRDLATTRLNEMYIVESTIALRLPEARSPQTPRIAPPSSPVETESVPTLPVEPPAGGDSPAREGPPLPSPPSPASLWQQLQDLPLNGVTIPDGAMKILLQGESLLEFAMDSRLQRQPYGISGELSLNSDELAAHAALRAPADEKVVTLQGEMQMQPGGLNVLNERYREIRRDIRPSLSEIVSSGAFKLDFLVEVPEDGASYGSAEATLNELWLQLPFVDKAFGFRDLVAAGLFRENRLDAEAGISVLGFTLGKWQSAPFGLRASFQTERGFTLESEAFDWSYGETAGKAALRGSARTYALPGEFPHRIELALSDIAGPGFSVEPFSLLFRGGGDILEVKSSPVGFRRNGTLWLEQLDLYWEFPSNAGHGSFAWYAPSGKEMGRVKAGLRRSNSQQFDLSLSLESLNGQSFLSLDSDIAPENMIVRARGDLELGWMNVINQWYPLLPLSLSGEAPRVDLSLSGKPPVMEGRFTLSLPGTTLTLDSGLVIRDMAGETAFRIKGLPRTEGLQQLTVREVSSGGFQLTDLVLDWEMPTMRTLLVNGLTARMGNALLRLDPFRMDPFEPGFRTRLHFDGLAGNQLLEWLNEERFAIEGNISGHVEIGLQEGTWVVGKGLLEMDAPTTENRFIFKDPAFLEEKFADMEGVSEELRGRFLEALLEQGIRIDSLQAQLGPAETPGDILLRIALKGESRTDRLELPVEQFVINNIISGEDLAALLGMFGRIRLQTEP